MSWLAARNDWPNYGELLAFQLPTHRQIDGPSQVEARIENDQSVSQQFTLWAGPGSQLVRGQLLVIPIAGTIIYVEPLYIQSQALAFPELKQVILADESNLVMADTINEGIAMLVGAEPEDGLADSPSGASGTPEPRPGIRRTERWANWGRWNKKYRTCGSRCSGCSSPGRSERSIGRRNPMTISEGWIAKEQQYYAQTVRRQPVVIVKGEGSRVWDADGKEYLDFVAGWAVDNLGHSHPVITQAIVEQAGTLIQTSNQFYTVPQVMLAELLVENSCLDRVFFGNSGAEANEGALKLAKKYGKQNRDGAYEVITAFNSFHGRTAATVAATGQPHYQEAFLPLQPGFVHVDFNDVEAIMNATTDRTAAVLLEPVQGEGGVNIPDDDYLIRVREWCDRNNLLLILDEVQTGLGRLGSLFGYQEYNVEPDVMTLAKGLGYGVPIGAFMSKEAAMALVPGRSRLHLRRQRSDHRRRLRRHQVPHRQRHTFPRQAHGDPPA